MDKIILVDGNNLLFRSYYATAYNGNLMKNSKNFPTNAIYGFVNMINKIVKEEKPNYIIVAFDKGKTFRHEKYDNYKDGRVETPAELKVQFPVAKKILEFMGIKYYEIDNYEADDIIGTFSEYCNREELYEGLIISSDKDLLQLITKDVEIKLLKQKDYIRYNESSFIADYGIDPIRIIDLKALMGDSSDNIPGVKGIGEKTALKLLHEYKSLDGIYNNIDSISGKLKEKLLNDKDNAYFSYELATIIKNVPLDININDIKYLGEKTAELNKIYEELEFYSLIKKEEIKTEDVDVKIINNIEEINIDGECAVYLDIKGTNYHNSEIIGMSVYNLNNSIYIPFSVLKENPKFLTCNIKYTYDIKRVYVALMWQGISIDNISFDTMIASSLLDYNIKDDIAYLANNFNYDIPFSNNKQSDLNIESISKISILKAKFIFETYEILKQKLIDEEIIDLFNNIELPLTYVLGDMEYNGVSIDINTLKEMGLEITNNLNKISNEIYELAGMKFNISSPKQLGEVLFDRLGLKHGKKNNTGYSTSIEVLNKIKADHPIIQLIIEYRNLSKLYTTYIEGLIKVVMVDNKIHTIYTQVLTRTGRLSSIEPNLQNIPIRSEYGRLIRKAFIPSSDSIILSSDYSQVELRILAHISGVKSLIDAFNNNEDIHARTASDIFKVDITQVTSDMRRMAKATNFGIIYGISSFGLAENLDISNYEAKQIIDNYLNTYPGVKDYMDKTIKTAYETGYVKTLMNRKRIIEELNNKNYMIRQQGERMALNTPIQGFSADLIKLAMINVHKEFKKRNLKSKMIIQVHDELVFDCLINELDIVKDIVKNTMEGIYKLNVPLKVDINYGETWYQAK